MAIKTYLYRPEYIAQVDLEALLAVGASPVIGTPTSQNLLPVTIDDSHKVDLDEAMATFGYVFVAEQTGTTGTSRRDYGVLLADPIDPPPSAGDMYFNGAMQLEMRYDGVRGKWLSSDGSEFLFGRNGPKAAGSYYNTVDGRVMSATLGFYAVRSGTVLTLGYTRSNALASTFEIMRNGAVIHSVPSAAAAGRDIAINADFSFGDIIAGRNRNPGGVTTDVVGWLRMQWRV